MQTYMEIMAPTLNNFLEQSRVEIRHCTSPISLLLCDKAKISSSTPISLFTHFVWIPSCWLTIRLWGVLFWSKWKGGLVGCIQTDVHSLNSLAIWISLLAALLRRNHYLDWLVKCLSLSDDIHCIHTQTPSYADAELFTSKCTNTLNETHSIIIWDSWSRQINTQT